MTKRTLFFYNKVRKKPYFIASFQKEERKNIFAPGRENEFASKYSDLVKFIILYNSVKVN